VVAAAWLQRASLASPGDIRLSAQLADAQLRAGHLDAARATIASALEQDPGNATLIALSRRTTATSGR
jgi:uncharacterized protein HemY